MKYQIVCDQSNRLRIRFGKYIFTKEQCYTLDEMLLCIDGVTLANANSVNGSILIEYSQIKTRQAILDTLSNIKLTDIKDGIPNEEQKAKMIDQEFKKKLIWHISKHFVKHYFLPNKIRNCITCVRAIPLMRMGARAIASHSFGVEVLDATAIATAIFSGNFKTSSSTMFLLKLSDLLLEYSNQRAKNALAQSLAINIEKVWVIRDDNSEIETSTNDLKSGDKIRIRKGSMIPVDGTIISGDALINEATMTGEPLSVHKTEKATVFAGTVLEDGEIDVEVLSLHNDTRISKIIEMIDTGEKEKANIHGKAERLADDIVPVSFGLFFATLLLTRNFAKALSVLMVDFSCAIKLATPISIISALRESVNNEVLVKGGKYLEVLSQVDTVVFDKTGTLTNAVPKVSKSISLSNKYSSGEILKIAACLEEHFPHSVASAIVKEAKDHGLHHPELHGKVEYIVAHGIASTYNEQRAVIGSKHFIFEDENVLYPHDKAEWLESEIGADSAIYLAINNEIAGVICINDPPRDDAKQTIELLRAEGIKQIIMITGDNNASAKYISDALGLDRYYASVLPDGKAEIIQSLKNENKVVLMVGDGVNDTPALSCADISLTMRGSSDLAREVADVSVMSDDLIKIVKTRQLATGLINKLHNQYRFILGFNSALIALGILGAISAPTSAWLHNASTMSLAAVSTRAILKEKKENETT